MSKPSYLFGTIHVKDRRVFNFSDSVMLAIKNCPSFALEVHPDTLVRQLFLSMQGEQDSSRSIEKMLTAEQRKLLAKKFEQKHGYPMGKISPIMLESLMRPDRAKPDDMVSFVDAYLFGIARTMHKNITGLEDMSAQYAQLYGKAGNGLKSRLTNFLDDEKKNTEAINSGMEEIIKIYASGNLDQIYEVSKNIEMDDSILIARNKVMAGSIIKYMAVEPLFAAIGAAHLPGPDGVIKLLQQAGYTVVPVKAGFTGIAAQYHIDYSKMDWHKSINADEGYELEFPGEPIQTEIMSVAKTTIYPDMANNIYYGIYTVPEGSESGPAGQQKTINRIIAAMGKGKANQLLSKIALQVNGQPCTEMLVKNVSGYLRMRLLLANNRLYCIYVGSSVKNLNLPGPDRYFRSFKNLVITPKPVTPWVPLHNAAAAFTVNFPTEPKLITKNVPVGTGDTASEMIMNLYQSTDEVNLKSYILRYNDYPAGMYLSDKTSLFNEMAEEFATKAKIIGKPTKIWMDGYESRELKMMINDTYFARVRICVRGNRVVVLLKQLLQAGKKDDGPDFFFDSFKFLPYAEPAYYSYVADSGNVKLQLVAQPEVTMATSKNKNNKYISTLLDAYATNPNSGGLYGVEISKISGYYRVPSIDSLYSRISKSLLSYKDTLLKTDTISVNGIQGRETLTMIKESGLQRRSRLLIDHDRVYYLTSRVDSTELFSKTSNVFFNSLSANNSATKVDLLSSKAEKIMNDLHSTDTLVSQAANGALSYYDFKKDELPYIYSALQKSYPDDSLSNGARYQLIEALQIVSDDMSAGKLLGLYPTLGSNDELKSVLLETLPMVDNKTGYEHYLDLLIKDAPLKLKYNYQLFNPLRDSIEITAKNFDRILPLIKYDAYRYNILSLAERLANDKETNYQPLLMRNLTEIIKHANADLDIYLKNKDKDDSDYQEGQRISSYLNLMATLREPLFTEQFTKRYLQKDPKGYYISNAVLARINNHLPNNPVILNKLLDSLGSRYEIMEGYQKAGQIAQIPLQYRSQQAFAKLCLYQEIVSADEDESAPEKLTLLGSITDKGSVYYAFKFSMPEREDNPLIGLAGPYKVGDTKLQFKQYHAYTDFKPVQVNWRAQAAKMIAPLKSVNESTSK